MNRYSDDDFIESSPSPSGTQVCRIQNIPIGHILASSKWRNTDVASKISESINVLYSSNIGIVDFHPSSSCAIIFITAAELVEGQIYKEKLEKFHSVKGIQKVVIAERTEISLVNFEALQRFAVFELQLTVIPVIPDNLAVLLVQMVSAENKASKNPFLNQKPGNEKQKFEAMVASSLKNIPKIGEKKIKQLLDKFGSLHNISSASLESLSDLLGPAPAQIVWEYFNK